MFSRASKTLLTSLGCLALLPLACVEDLALSQKCDATHACGEGRVCIVDTCAPEGTDAGPAGDDAGPVGEGEGEAGEGEAGEGEAGEGEGEAGEGEGEDNNAPVVTPTAVGRMRVGESAVVATVSDADGDALALAQPLDAALVLTDGVVTFTPVAEGAAVIEVSVTDGTAVASALVNVDVVAADWIDLGLTARRRLSVAPVAGALDVVTGVPVAVLVRRADVGDAFFADLGTLALFVDGDGAVLPHEIERATVDEILFWTRPAAIDARAGASDFFSVYAGGTTALVAGAPASVWAGFASVYHLESFDDASALHAPAVNQGSTAATCLLAGCRSFNGGGGQSVELGTNRTEVENVPAVTVSLTGRWQGPDNDNNEAVAAMWTVEGGTVGRVGIGVDDNDPRGEGFFRIDDNNPFTSVVGGPSLTSGEERRLDFVVDGPGGVAVLFVDGVERARRTFNSDPGFDSGTSGRAIVGRAAQNALAWEGTVDEVRIARVARSPSFIAVDAAARALTLVTLAP